MRSELGGIEDALKQCSETNAIKRVLLRGDLLQRVRKYDSELSNVLQSYQVSPPFYFPLAGVALIFHRPNCS